MKKLSILIILAFILTTLHAQKPVLGTVTYTYNVIGEGAEAISAMMPTKMVMKYGENGMSMVMEGGMMAAMMGKTIVNGKTGEVFMVKDAEETVYVMTEEEIEANAEQVEGAVPKKIEGTREVLGYKCEKYIVSVEAQGNSMSQILWVSKDLASPDYKGKAFKGLANNNMNFDVDGFPLLIEIDVPGMPVKMELEVTDIKFEKISQSEFNKPTGYTEKPFSSMMGM